MAVSSGSMEDWRKFFHGTNSDIFEVIEQAILVAAADCPQEFKNRRDRIAEKLFTCRVSRCFGCNRVELQVAGNGDDTPEEEGGSVKRVGGEKDSKVESCNGDPEDLNRGVSNYSYDEAEALTEVIEEENQMIGEVLRIKEILGNKQDESDALLFESLRRLQLMQLSVEALKATEIGRAVNGLRKHNSKQIRHLVRTLIEDWKVMVGEWVNATANIADHSHDSVNPSVVDEEEGLPSPPLDEGAFLATQTTSIQLSEFFDGMDDDGNFRTSGDIDKSQDIRRLARESHRPVRWQEPLNYSAISEERAPMKRQEVVLRQTKPHVSNVLPKAQGIVNKLSKLTSADSGPGRPVKLASEQKISTQVSEDHRRTSNTPQECKNLEEALVRAKLELAKRKLHEGYQLAKNAKKQRTIQVMELHDLPKQSHAHRPTSGMKPKNQSRNLANPRW